MLFLLRFGAAAEFLGRDRFEHVHVAPTEVRVPRRRASTRDDDEASRVDAGFAQRPGDEGDPIEQLESDLARPWTDDDRPRTLGQPLDASPDAALVDAQRFLPVGEAQRLRQHAVLTRAGGTQLGDVAVQSANILVLRQARHLV